MLPYHQLKNCFDILLGYREHTFLIEIKVTKRNKLTPGEAEFQRTWCGAEYQTSRGLHHLTVLALEVGTLLYLALATTYFLQ